MPPIDDIVLAKLQKILARADTSRGATEAEARTAMEMAQKLAIEHNIDLARIGPADVGPKKMDTDRKGLKMYNKYRPYSEPIAHVLQECFDVRFIWVGSEHPCIVGEKTDVALASYCWAWLNEAFPRLFRQYCDARGLPFLTGIPRRSYYEGLGRGIRESNQRQREEVKKTADGASFALVLVKKEEIVEARMAIEFPRLKKARARHHSYDNSAFGEGFAQGQKIKLNGGLGGGAPKGALT